MYLSVRASRHAAAGDRRDTHARGAAVGTCASEARPSRVVCAWPAPPGRFEVVAVTVVVGVSYVQPWLPILACPRRSTGHPLPPFLSREKYPSSDLGDTHKKKGALVDNTTHMSKRRMIHVKGLGPCLR